MESISFWVEIGHHSRFNPECNTVRCYIESLSKTLGFWYTKWCLRIDSIQGFFEVVASFANIYCIANQKMFMQTFNWQKYPFANDFFWHLICIFFAILAIFISYSFGKYKNCQMKIKGNFFSQIRWKTFFKFLNG